MLRMDHYSKLPLCTQGLRGEHRVFGLVPGHIVTAAR